MDRKKFLQDISRKIGQFQMQHWRTKIETRSKTHETDLVSFVDETCEQMFIDALQEAFPGECVYGEETFDPKHDYKNEKHVWLIDPLDGTLPYLRGLHFFGVSIAYVESGIVQLGAIYLPPSNELFFSDETGSYCNEMGISVSERNVFDESIFHLSRYHLGKYQQVKKLDTDYIFRQGASQLNVYSAVNYLTMVANGTIEAGMFYGCGGPWDTAAGGHLIQQAGGKITKFDGSQWDPFDQHCVFSNGHIHDEFLSLFQG